MAFPQHGVIFTAFHPPPEKPSEGPTVEPQEVSPGGAPPHVKAAMEAQTVVNLVAHVDSCVQSSSEPEEEVIEKAVASFVSGASAESMSQLISIIERNSAVMGDDRRGRRIPQILEAVRNRHRQQLC